MPNKKTAFHFKDMDCPSEEQIIRMALEPLGNVAHLEFDIPNRTLEAYHHGDPDSIAAALAPLKLGAKAIETTDEDPSASVRKATSNASPLVGSRHQLRLLPPRDALRLDLPFHGARSRLPRHARNANIIKASTGMTRLTVSIQSMNCASCAVSIQNKLAVQKGIESVHHLRHETGRNESDT